MYTVQIRPSFIFYTPLKKILSYRYHRDKVFRLLFVMNSYHRGIAFSMCYSQLLRCEDFVVM